MTIKEAIAKIDALKPNTYTEAEKKEWLGILDGIIYRQIILTHEDSEGITYEPYTADTDEETELLVGNPYDEMYVLWLESKIDYYNAELTRYNNSITRWNDTYSAFRNDYNREHMPIGAKFNNY